jgi:hypothetical protein
MVQKTPESGFIEGIEERGQEFLVQGHQDVEQAMKEEEEEMKQI